MIFISRSCLCGSIKIKMGAARNWNLAARSATERAVPIRYHSEPVPQTGVGISRMNGIAARKQKEGRLAAARPFLSPWKETDPRFISCVFPGKGRKLGTLANVPTRCTDRSPKNGRFRAAGCRPCLCFRSVLLFARGILTPVTSVTGSE